MDFKSEHVSNVRPTSTSVFKLPDLNRSSGNIRKNSVGNIGKDHAIDLPFAVGAVELEVVIDTRSGGCREVNNRQGRGNGACVGNGRVRYDEAHHLVSMQIIIVPVVQICQFLVLPVFLAAREDLLSYVLIVSKGDVLSSEPGKVKNDLLQWRMSARNPTATQIPVCTDVAFTHRDPQIVRAHRASQESGIGSDDLEGNFGRRSGGALEVQTEAPRKS
jgi:hypothetical protein